MIKLLGCCFHNNVGDCLTTKYQRGLIETILNKDVTRISYGVFHKENLFELQYNTEMLVIGTGGLFGAWHTAPLFAVENDSMYDLIRIPIVVWGSGFNIAYKQAWSGTPLDEAFYHKVKLLLSKCKLVGMRTKGDAELAEYISGRKCYFAPDPILFIGSDTKSIKRKIGVAIDAYCDMAFPNIIDELKWYFSGCEIVPIAHELSDKRFWSSCNTFSLQQYQDCDIIISGKFHSGLFATAYGKPFFTLEHNIKQTFYREMVYGEEDCYIRPQDRKLLFDKLSWFIGNKYYLKQRTIDVRESMRDYHQEFCNMFLEI